MKKNEIIKNLKFFREIQPKEEFSNRSKTALLSYFSQNKSYPKLETTLAKKESPKLVSSLVRKVAVSFSFTLAALILLVGIFYLTREISPLFLPGLNESKIRAEAEVINNQINIKFSQLEKFKETASQENKILRQTATNQLDHLNEIVLDKEKKEVDLSSAQSLLEKNKELNQILESLSQE